jgi:hypothetical protein
MKLWIKRRMDGTPMDSIGFEEIAKKGYEC